MAHKHSFTNVVVHVVWATRCRAPVLSQEHDAWLARIVTRKCFESGCQVFAVGNGSDHVHTAIRLGSTVAVSDVARRMKGASSRLWNLSHGPRLLWQDGYWAESIRPEDLPRLCDCIDNQRQHHLARTVTGRWMLNVASTSSCGASNESAPTDPLPPSPAPRTASASDHLRCP